MAADPELALRLKAQRNQGFFMFITACGGLLERWTIERLDALWEANTEKAAIFELQLVKLDGIRPQAPSDCN